MIDYFLEDEDFRHFFGSTWNDNRDLVFLEVYSHLKMHPASFST